MRHAGPACHVIWEQRLVIAALDGAHLIELEHALAIVRKAIRSPCGDQTAAALSAGPNVSRETAPRARSNNQMSGTLSFGSTSDGQAFVVPRETKVRVVVLAVGPHGAQRSPVAIEPGEAARPQRGTRVGDGSGLSTLKTPHSRGWTGRRAPRWVWAGPKDQAIAVERLGEQGVAVQEQQVARRHILRIGVQ